MSGYARQTTPQLAALPVINFSDVTSCGTNTEMSLPCMFAPVGRRDYDEAAHPRQRGLLQVLARAGVAVHWRDNQSGCKGVCDGLSNDTVQGLNAPGLCADGRCLDEGLLQGIDRRLAQAQGTQVLVLHQLGNHGPAYFRRYPPAFARFTPACEDEDLQHCTREQIVNAYDNALLYTDHVLALLISQLQARASSVDSALVVRLRPWRVARREAPVSARHAVCHRARCADQGADGAVGIAGFAEATGLDLGCMRQQAKASVGHDHLFHTMLGLLDVNTALYEPQWDFTAACRRSAAAVQR